MTAKMAARLMSGALVVDNPGGASGQWPELASVSRPIELREWQHVPGFSIHILVLVIGSAKSP
jgi:hypothetical protein